MVTQQGNDASRLQANKTCNLSAISIHKMCDEVIITKYECKCYVICKYAYYILIYFKITI